MNRETYQFQALKLELATDLGANHWLGVSFIACANEECRQVAVTASLAQRLPGKAGGFGAAVESWSLRPRGCCKHLPSSVPGEIREDYQEAAQILELSPAASAAISRRCLQRMIRDCWGVQKGRLADELDDIEDKLDPDVCQAIAAVRGLGNIGAHMEREINVITDVEPEEAKLLLQLVEDLINDWYVRRVEKQRRMARLVAAANKAEAAPATAPRSLPFPGGPAKSGRSAKRMRRGAQPLRELET